MGNTSGLAIASLVLGICSLILGWIPVIGWLIITAGLVISIIALVKISKDNTLGGKGMAIAGLVMSAIALIFYLVILIGALAYFGATSPDRFVPSKCVIVGGFSCVDYKLDESNNAIRIQLQNNVGTDLNNVVVSLASSDGTPCVGKGNIISPMLSGERTQTITFTGCGIGKSSSFKGEISIAYTRQGESDEHTAPGSISLQ